MQKEEFQLRYMWYEYMSERFGFNWDEETLLWLSDRTDEWVITKKLTEVSPWELKEATLKSYTTYKKDFLKKHWNIKIKKHTLKDYIDRLEYELKVINEMGYDTYFLIVQDYIMYAKRKWIVVWPWRGSAAWSLLSYLIRITEIDPLEYDLLFERFLNPARVSMPDIDTDFEDAERDTIIEYCKKKYWIEKVANIWTYMTMAAKASFKDVARVFWVSFTKANAISANIEESIDKSYNENKEFKATVDEDDTLKDIIKYSSKLEWTVRQLGVHACWVIISPEKIETYSPIQYPPKPWGKEPDFSRIVTQYDWHYLEDIGLLKMDFLWLRNLSIIKNTIKIVQKKAKNEWKKIDKIYEDFFRYYVFEPDIKDKATYKIFQEWDTIWVFQFESDGMRSWLKKLKPESIDDIIAMVSLYRPWPMEWIPNYIDRKLWKEEVSYLSKELHKELTNKYWKKIADEQKDMITKDLSPFMDITYWIPIYQEQLMRIVQAMADFSLGEADLLRRWVGKKIKEVIDKLKWQFVEKAAKKWYKKEVTLYIYEKMIEPASNYSFNKSHAACYAIIAYQTAYLKAHHPIEFYAALLRSVEENTDRFAELLEELKIKWIKISPVNVNTSFNHITAVVDSIVIWFLAIKWIGYEVWKFIEEQRQKNGLFKDLEDFLTRTEKYINKKTLEALIQAWALDVFEERSILNSNIDTILKWSKQSKQRQESSWMWLFGDDILWREPLKLKKTDKLTKMEKLYLEYKTFWTFVSSHPFDGLYEYIKKKYNFSTQIKNEKYEWDFKIMWFIKNIAKTKFWLFSIDVEDFVWNINFYIKSTPWLNLFDVIVIEWRKKGKLSIQKIYKINLEKLIDKLKSKWKYNEEETVAKIRIKRIENTDSKMETSINSRKQDEKDFFVENKANNNPEKEIEKKQEDIEATFDMKDTISKNQDKINYQSKWKKENDIDLGKNTVYQQVHLELPEDIEIIDKIANYKKENPKAKEVIIDNDIYLI